MFRKVYVQVNVDFLEDGQLRPRSILWENDRRYEIDRVLDACPAASLKAGGQGMRYTCMIQGKQTHMFLEDGRWFVEAKA